MDKRVLITGITGQDGSYLAELLLARGYKVFGATHDPKCAFVENIAHLKGKVELRYLDLSESGSITKLLTELEPSEVYNFAAQSYVDFSWEIPEVTGNISGMSVLRMLEAIRIINPKIRFYQASSSEIFAGNDRPPFNEDTPIHPKTPYGCAKAFAQHITRSYRERYGLYAVSGILFNHESPRRGRDFLSKKVARAVAAIKRGKEQTLKIGRLDVRRDWGYAPDYVEAIYLMMHQETPRDFVFGTGKSHSVEDLVRAACVAAELEFDRHVVSDPSLFRAVDSPEIRSDPARAMSELGWKPRTSLDQMVRIMVEHELGNA